jgi:hypothetical protein
MVTAPVSPLGQRLDVRTCDATAVVAPTTLAVDPARTHRPENEEQPIHPLYGYLYVTDREEGLIIVGAATLLDGDPTNNFLRRAVTFNPASPECAVRGAQCAVDESASRLAERVAPALTAHRALRTAHRLLDGAVALAFAGTYAYVACDRGIVVVDLDDPLHPRVVGEVGAPFLRGPRAIAVQFRYAFVCDDEGLKALDITHREHPTPVPGAVVPLAVARDVYVARTYAYVAAGRQGLAIVDVERPEQPRLDQVFDAGGALNDARAVKVGMTNASLFAYVADGRNGLRILQLTTPGATPGHFGFSPKPAPRLIATYPTRGPALALSKGLDRDRAVDESGHQIAVFGRRGARPFNREEMERLYLRDGRLYTVTDSPPGPPTPSRAASLRPSRTAASAGTRAHLPAAVALAGLLLLAVVSVRAACRPWRR